MSAMSTRRAMSMLGLLVAIGAGSVSAGCASLLDGRARGHVLSVSDDTIEVDIGSADGAASGQELEVGRWARSPWIAPKNGGGLTLARVGHAKVEQVVDDHHSQATILDGRGRKGDVVRVDTN